jgi:uroporphyrinogen decarboxylase
MNSFERIIAAVHFQETDRVPVVSQVFGHAARLAKVSLSNYVRDGELLADCQLKALNHYGYDAVFALMDVSVESEACGSQLIYWHDQYPAIETYALNNNFNLDLLVMPKPQETARMPELLKALKILRQELGDQVLVVGSVLGPMTLATQLLGIDRTLYLIIDEPELFEALLDFAVDVIIQFGVSQLESGAHLPVVFNPSASPAVIPAEFFYQFEFPRLKKVFQAFKQAGAVANWLHIAGPVQSILAYYPKIGVDIANIDYCVKPSFAMQTLPKICINGNLRPLAFVDSKPDEIARESHQLMNLFAKRGGYILSPGCEIPPESCPENIISMVRAARMET